jgi:hypothetical protein
MAAAKARKWVVDETQLCVLGLMNNGDFEIWEVWVPDAAYSTGNWQKTVSADTEANWVTDQNIE